MSRAIRLVLAAAVSIAAVALAAAGCREGDRGGPSSPREAFAAVRAAIAAGDSAALVRLFDDESVTSFRAVIRERRALLERGDDPAEVLRDMPLSPEELQEGEEEDVVARMLPRRSRLMTESSWYLGATVVEERMETPDTAVMRLRGPDGREHDAWFVRERGSWRFDNYRTARPW